MARIEGSPALPIGLLSQPPRPLARLAQPSSLPPRQEPSSRSSSLQPQAQTTDRPAGQWRQLFERFQNTLPLPSRWACTVCRNRQESRWVSAFSPSPLTPSGHEMQPTGEGSPPGMTPYFSQLNWPISLFSPANLSAFLNTLGPLPTAQSSHRTLWS